jgi:predicted Kef-type K+ transport protein
VHEVLTLLGISVAAVAVFSRFHLPPIVGYLFVGDPSPALMRWVSSTLAE